MKIFSQYRGLRKENYILFIGRLVTNMGSMVYPVMTLLLSQKLGMSATEISVFEVILSLLNIPAGLIGGKLADHFNKKMIIVWCDAVSVTLFLIGAFSPMSIVTVIILGIAAVFQTAEYPAYNALIADLNVTEDRARAYSLQYLGANLGLVATPTVAGYLLNRNTSLIFLISGISIAISTVFIFIFVKNITPVTETGEASIYQEDRAGTSVFRILKENPGIVLFFVTLMLYECAYSQYGFLMPLDLSRVHGEAGAEIFGTVSSTNCIEVVLLTAFVTTLFSKVRDTKKSLIGYLLVTAGYAVYLFIGLFLHLPAFYYVGIIIFTLGEILTTITTDPFITARIPASHRGRVNGIMNVLGSVFGALITIVIGYLYDSFGGNGATGSLVAWLFIFGILLFAIIGGTVIVFVDKKYYRKLYESRESAISTITEEEK